MLANKLNNITVLNTSGINAVHVAVVNANSIIIKAFKQANAYRDRHTLGGKTPLHWAVTYEKSDMVPTLTEEGANLDVRDKLKEWTALHFAARDGDVHIVEALVDAGANFSARDPNGCTPVHVAAACCCSPVFLLLSC